MTRKRLRMSDWLLEHLNSNTLSDQIWWINRESRIFAIKWIHGSRQNYDALKDASLFRLWAAYTGRFVGHQDDPKRWKANFRCALRSLPDIQPITGFRQNKMSTLQFQFVDKYLDNEKQRKRKSLSQQKKDKILNTIKKQGERTKNITLPTNAVTIHDKRLSIQNSCSKYPELEVPLNNIEDIFPNSLADNSNCCYKETTLLEEAEPLLKWLLDI